MPVPPTPTLPHKGGGGSHHAFQIIPNWEGATALDLFAAVEKDEEAIPADAVPDTVVPFAAPKAEKEAEPLPASVLSPSPAEPPSRPLYLFDPPLPIETLAEVPEGPPLLFRWRRVQHQVARAEGPERIAPEWWRRGEDSLTRDYYRVEDSEGRRFWLFREGLYGRETGAPRWFVHGLFA